MLFRSNESYTAVTAHWIDDSSMSIRNLTLSCDHSPGPSQSEDIQVKISSVLSRFSVELKDVYSLTTDTNHTMKKMGKSSYEQHGIKWIPCIDHRLQLITKLAFDDKNLPGVDNVMSKARRLITHFDKSAQRSFLLRELQINNII